ncbi:MAG: NAD(P)-dependent oxidoreductase, partial [Spirochaetaceae bacterium]
ARQQKIVVCATSFFDVLLTEPSKTGEAARRLQSAAEERGFSVEYRCERNPLNPMSPEELESVTAVIADLEGYDRELLSRVGTAAGGSLELISRYGTGCSSIDLDAAREYGVTVTNTPGVNALPMAEWALGTMIDVAGRRIQHHERASTGKRKTGPSRIDLSGKKVGILGTGFSGKYLASLLSGFKADIYAYAPRPDKEWAEEQGVKYRELEELCEISDFISLHASASYEIIGRKEISRMKPTTVLVNCARNVLVDNRAVWEAVRDGRLWGYGLDEVWEHEDMPLEGLNIITTPHVGSDTDKGKLGMQMGSVQAVIDFIEGKIPKHCVTS